MDASPEEIRALADQLSQLASATASNPSDQMHKRMLVLQAKKIISRVQDPFDALMDHVVNAYTIGSALALMDMGVFEAIPATGSIGIKELAQTCSADEALIIRLMRQLTCVNICDEVKVGEWAHNRLSIGLSKHHGVGGKNFFEVCMDEMVPCMHRLNHYLKQYGRHDVLTYTETPHSWQDGKLGQNFWQIIYASPARFERFSLGLSLFDSLHPVVAMFPFVEVLQPNNSASRVLAVDIGGGRGLAMLEFRKNCPTLHGELVLQDQASVLDKISDADLPGVTKMVHDFFTPQPVKHAQMYYIRRVLHDWQDADAARILRAIVPAMAKDSRIIISDMAMPEPVSPMDAGAVWLDLMMMTIGGKERTVRDWEKLADSTNLKLVKVWQEPMRYGPLCVVEYMLPDDHTQGEGHATNGVTAESKTETHGEGTGESTVEAVTAGLSQAEISTGESAAGQGQAHAPAEA